MANCLAFLSLDLEYFKDRVRKSNLGQILIWGLKLLEHCATAILFRSFLQGANWRLVRGVELAHGFQFLNQSTTAIDPKRTPPLAVLADEAEMRLSNLDVTTFFKLNQKYYLGFDRF